MSGVRTAHEDRVASGRSCTPILYTYGPGPADELHRLFTIDRIRSRPRNRVLVVGSENPWLEYELFKMTGIDLVTTSDYADLSRTLFYPERLRYMHPDDLMKKGEHYEQYDMAFSYSRYVGHDALSRLCPVWNIRA
jgi:hypothetical protein